MFEYSNPDMEITEIAVSTDGGYYATVKRDGHVYLLDFMEDIFVHPMRINAPKWEW